jgi:hypothetical protein
VAVPHPLDQPLDLEDQIQQFQCLTFLKPHHCQPHQPTLCLPKYHLNNLPTTTQNKQWKSFVHVHSSLVAQYHDMITYIKDKNRRNSSLFNT